MLNQGPTSDHKCKLNISSFLTLPHSLDCLICTKNTMSIVLLLQIMADVIGGSCRSPYSFFSCSFVFCSPTSSVPYLGH